MKIDDVNSDGKALDGFDPVSYHNGEPLKGKEHLNYEVDGKIYLFATEENLQAFQNDPGRFTGPLHSKKGSPLSDRVNEHRNLEDKLDDVENNVPMEMKEDGTIEMQNLSDSRS